MSVFSKKKSDEQYNYRQVTGRTSDFNGLENYQPYLFSVAGTYNGTVSEYTHEITAEPVDWATDPNNPDNAVNKTIAARTPKYLGVVETVPTIRTVVITKGGRLGAQDANAGDWVLMAKTVGGWKVGVCYRWTGSQWINLEPEYNYTEQYQAALYHICEIEELMKNTGHFGALFAKVLVAQKALIDELLVNQAFIKNLIVQKLHIDSDDTTHQDFEAWFDKTNGLKINNKGKEIFKVDIAGNVFAKNAQFENATLIDGMFTGSILSGPLELINTAQDKKTLIFKENTNIKVFFNSYGTIDYFGQGTYKGVNINRIVITNKTWATITLHYEFCLYGEHQTFVFLYRESIYNGSQILDDEKLSEKFIFNVNSDTKTMKLKKLPKNKPSNFEIVYIVEKEGIKYLCIS